MSNPSDKGGGEKPKPPPSKTALDLDAEYALFRPDRSPATPTPAVALPSVAPPVAPRAAGPAAPAGQPPAQGAGAPGGGADPILTSALQRIAALATLDYFQILQLPPTAGPAEIKRAFYDESRKLHPDRFFQLPDAALKQKLNELYKRVTEAYYVLRDDRKRRQYAADIAGPDRARKLRFSEATEAELKDQRKREVADVLGTNLKARPLFQAAIADIENERWTNAERNIKMGLMFDPQNSHFREQLAKVQQAMKVK